MSELNPDVIPQIADELGVSCEAVEKFLSDECGAYADLDDDKIWLSGQLVARIIAVVT